MVPESIILQAVRSAGDPIAIHELATATGVDTNNTGAMQNFRTSLRAMVHRRQILQRNGLDGILRYMLPAAAAPKAPAPSRQPLCEPAGSESSPVPTVTDEALEQAATEAVAMPTNVMEALKGLHSKTILVFQAMREGEWVERGTLDFRTKLASVEVRSALIALRKRGLVVAQGKTSNMQWSRSAVSVPAIALAGSEEASLVTAHVDAIATSTTQTVTADTELSTTDYDDACRYRWLMQHATISVAIGAVSMKTECSPNAPGAKLLWDGAIDTIRAMSPAHGEAP